MAGLIGLGFAVAAGVLRRGGRELRTPTKGQLKDISDPLSRMLLRHADMTALGPDLGDVIAAGAAAGAYATEDRLVKPLAGDPGLPDPSVYQE